jgi:hypothetical protein
MKKQFDVWRFDFPKKGEHPDIYDLRFTIDDFEIQPTVIQIVNHQS